MHGVVWHVADPLPFRPCVNDPTIWLDDVGTAELLLHDARARTENNAKAGANKLGLFIIMRHLEKM